MKAWTTLIGRFGRIRGGGAAASAALLVLAALGRPGVGYAGEGPSRVTLFRAPDGGIQPQAVADASGTVHVVTFHGEPASGDVQYTRLDPGTKKYAPAVRVNSEAGSAIAIGTIRGAQIALGRGGRVHVAWNGSKSRPADHPLRGVPMLYSRSDAGRSAFEPQRDLMTRSMFLDGGGTVAADGAGHVLVAWHGRPEGASEGEANRRLFVARSGDDGATFAPEVPATETPTGACACCGTRALLTPGGAAYVLFRAATGGTARDMILLTSRDAGVHFETTRAHEWRLNMCPMSSESLAAGRSRVVAAWETQGQVYASWIEPEAGGAFSTPAHPRGSGGNRKHPAVAVNDRGEFVIAWAEDTSFQRGGSLAWRVFDASGKPTDDAGRVEGGIPAHSLPTAVPRPDGGFTIIH